MSLEALSKIQETISIENPGAYVIAEDNSVVNLLHPYRNKVLARICLDNPVKITLRKNLATVLYRV